MTKWEVTKAVRASKLTAPAKLVMFALADIADVGTAEIPERFTPSLTVLAAETSLGRSTVARVLNDLEADGWVVRTRPETTDAIGRYERTRYQLQAPPSVVAAPVPERDQSQNGTTPSATASGPSAGTGHPSATAGHRVRSSSDLDQIKDQSRPTADAVALPDRLDVENVCRYLADRIEANGSKRPTITKAWRDAARRLIDRDGRTVEQITRAIDWCQDDPFWKANVLSLPKLREKYDQLRLQAQRGATGTRPSTTDQRVAQAQALKERFRGVS